MNVSTLNCHIRTPRAATQTYGKLAVVVVAGSEDGVRHIGAVCFQALNDVGFTIPGGK
ncbi:hypothetical protein GCM10023258_33120 [Terrabacter aeriphilus]|uniref:Uncharacterized protein n=1 Tax=Terrabacter aeriphilus TaxID=515662 RepID=A0ABP9JIV0_9MICO